MKTNIKYSLLLVLTAVIWGAAFVAQSAGMEYVGPFTFNGIRCIIGALVLAPVAMFFDKKDGVMTSWKNRDLVLGGCICGILLFLATSSQQVGIIYTTAGKAGFITALYIVLVPIFSFMLKKKPPKHIWISVCLSIIGLYFLCLSETFRISPGDIWMFACAILFALQIIAVDKFAPHMDVIKLSCYQFAVSGALSIIPMIQEKPVMTDVLNCWLPIVYAGALSGGVAYTLQMEAQKRVNATVACIIMSLESVFSAVFGFLILGQRLTGREIIGCVVMFAAVILAQLSPTKKA
ncbi:MAG: DMT family transporter [Lachnospiraceae bacterium]|jgi:drug/metabolite transporter (DMT)-like permease|nr:DMT family transporter [Lachnospiraceae bacterium]